MTQTIAVLDFGSQYTQVIARRIRECGVYSKIYPYSTSVATLKKDKVCGVICSGGPESVLSPGSPRPDLGIFKMKVPFLGICYGLQLMAELLGGKVEYSARREYGHGTLTLGKKGKLFQKLPKKFRVWNSHGDKIVKLPRGFQAVAHTENSTFAAIEDAQRQFYGLQFHPEVSHTEYGQNILRNFLLKICGCRQDWSIEHYIKSSSERIRKTVGDKGVILGLSGGVDSAVAAALIHEAIGDKLTCVFVDNGLLRLNERQKVQQLIESYFNINLVTVRAEKFFLDKLKGVTNPERKRKIIGNTFVQVFNRVVKKLKNVDFLAQGTLYSDVIESASTNGNAAALIKSHHNVGGLPKNMKLKLLEPLRELFKDEVRALGSELGMPQEILGRHPFPGPGLAVRVMETITRSKLDLLRNADAILDEELRRAGWYDKVWQSFCVLLPVRTVGVMGDERTYERVVALRIVESHDAMTADWARLPYDLLRTISSRIINEVKGINRVVLDISSKPPSTIEWE